MTKNRRHLEEELRLLSARMPALKAAVAESQRALSTAEKRKGEIVELLAPEVAGGVRVSDHALLRYLQKRFNFDLDELRNEILTPDRIAAIETGAHKISVDGLGFIVKEKTVVTVVD